MGSDNPVYIAGVFEHPTREAPEKSTMQLHAEVADGVIKDAGLEKDDIDGYCTSGVPEYTYAKSSVVMADYLGLDVSYADSTEFGGASYLVHVGHAMNAIRAGKCDVVLITLAGRPRSRKQDTGTGVREMATMQDNFERIYGEMGVTNYAMAARRHMYEYGTTSEQLAAIREAASYHAQFNEHALYQDPVTVEDVVESRMIADPLHLLDCCVISDGGGAVVVVSEEVAAELDRDCVEILGQGEAIGDHRAGRVDVTESAAKFSGERAFEEAGVGPEDVDYVSLYDSFTITVLETIEDLGFCEKGEGGSFVEGGTLKAPDGELPFNTDGGGLSSNHPANRGGMTKIIESVRQLRGEANEEVQVPDAEIALAHGTGGRLSTRHGCGTLILGRADR